METSFISKKTNRENDSSGERTRLLFVFFYRTPMCVLLLVCNRIPDLVRLVTMEKETREGNSPVYYAAINKF